MRKNTRMAHSHPNLTSQIRQPSRTSNVELKVLGVFESWHGPDDYSPGG
ncbi:MAG: hypothetical protein ABR556_07970 [Pyrinomonadaceae bacterium]